VRALPVALGRSPTPYALWRLASDSCVLNNSRGLFRRAVSGYDEGVAQIGASDQRSSQSKADRQNCSPFHGSEKRMNDPIAILKQDHREAAAMLKQLAVSKPGATRRKTTERLVAALRLHMEIEEQLVYPLVAKLVGEDEEHEAEIEHGLARDGLAKMVELVDEVGFGAAVAMVTAGIKHHVKEEETEIFPMLKAELDRDELSSLGDAVVMRKQKSAKSRRAA
jgi:hemerythrin-like domain-containing protein